MILATGNRSRGFTLIEIILVVALIALGSGLVIANFIAFADRGESELPADILHRAVRSARFVAASDRTTTALSYDQESCSLVIDPSGESFALGETFANSMQAEVRFYRIPSTQGLNASSGTSRGLETNEVLFAPDRSSTRFYVEIDEGRGTPTRIAYDPFSGAVLDSE